MTEPNDPRKLIEITDEVVWHHILENPIMYIEDAGLDGVRWVYIAHLAEIETPGEDVDNDHLLDGGFEPRFTVCWNCWQAANDKISKEMLDNIFPPDGDK